MSESHASSRPILPARNTSSRQTLHRLMRWLMLGAGLLTCTMFYAALAPQAVLQATFGQSIDGPVAEILVRNWGVLVGLVGLLLIHGAVREDARRVALLVAAASKAAFVALVLGFGQQLLGPALLLSLAFDASMVLLFATYLLLTRGEARPARPDAGQPLA